MLDCCSLPGGFCLIVGISSHVVRVTKEGTTIMNELHCSSHSSHTLLTGSKVVIHATDTDIILIVPLS